MRLQWQRSRGRNPSSSPRAKDDWAARRLGGAGSIQASRPRELCRGATCRRRSKTGQFRRLKSERLSGV